MPFGTKRSPAMVILYWFGKVTGCMVTLSLL